jgi:hypothetical protein
MKKKYLIGILLTAMIVMSCADTFTLPSGMLARAVNLLTQWSTGVMPVVRVTNE